jgi:hypothetical protein
MLAVRGANVAAWRTSGRDQRRNHDIARWAEPSPLDLDAEEVATDFQCEIGTPMFGDRPQHGHAELRGGEDNRLLCHSAFDVRIHDERMFA